jgi:hypothetical protein
MEEVDDLKRALRTALRSIEAIGADLPNDESCRHMAAAVRQLTFAVDKLVDLLLQTKSDQIKTGQCSERI